MTDWINKTLMEMTVLDEISAIVCIIAALAIIFLVGWIVEILEERWKKK